MRPLTKQILAYLLFVFLFSSVPYYFMIHTGHIGAGNGLVVALVMWCPAFAALTTCRLFGIDLVTLGWNWRPARYVKWAYVIPVLYALPVYLVAWIAIRGSFAFAAFAAPWGTAFGFPNWPRATAMFLVIPGYAVLGVISSTARALGEEIGWRGFLLPPLGRQAGFRWWWFPARCGLAVGAYPGLAFVGCYPGVRPSV